MHEVKYRVADRARKERLRKLTNVADPENLESELGLARLLASEATEQGNIGTANLILGTIAKLSHSQTALRRVKAEYLDRTAVLRLMREIVDTVSRAIQGKFVGWEAALDQVAAQLTGSITTAANDEPKAGASE